MIYGNRVMAAESRAKLAGAKRYRQRQSQEETGTASSSISQSPRPSGRIAAPRAAETISRSAEQPISAND